MNPPTTKTISKLNVAALVSRTEVEGPGVRFALWVQGCPFRCEGCCNPQFLDRNVVGDLWDVDELAQKILTTEGLEGLTLLGGEPFAQAEPLARLARRVRTAGLSVMIFTGYPIEALTARTVPGSRELLEACDLLVDGPYVASQASTARRFIGSDNQRLHFLSERYRALDGHWPRGDKGIELRLRNGVVTINGHPVPELTAASLAAMQQAKGPQRGAPR
ncbi:MAG: hypothetical protein AUK47_00450 [Deltaproteobacteria bacterium CG2_30_63_29]|nr:MAG: hypothetical protein AUK47_00450 [Deltaproteobacteria bacterium CG2_30_63_29]